eukprot:m.162836 g.162836  ORF g.162836 m.162836 type:complete len:404 (-) comp12241_c0_seq1:51-1262(-)
MALRELDDREAILADLSAEGELLTPDVIEKYRLAGTIAAAALGEAVLKCTAGARLADICAAGDAVVEARVAKVFAHHPDVEKGSAWPTCVSLNEKCNNVSPATMDTTVVQAGDVAKICIGVHIDGYMAYVGHTVVVPSPEGSVDTGGGADGSDKVPSARTRSDHAAAAVRDAAVVVSTLMRPGVSSDIVTKAIEHVASAYGCKPVGGVLSSSMKRFVPTGKKQWAVGKSEDPAPARFEFVEGEVYDVNIMMSTGTGSTRLVDESTTVFKRNLAVQYSLRTKAARQVYSDISKRFPTMPFSVRSLPTTLAALGLKECVGRGLIMPIPTACEASGQIVAQYRFTAILYNGKTISLAEHGMEGAAPTPPTPLTPVVASLLGSKPCRPAKQSKWTTNTTLADAIAQL